MELDPGARGDGALDFLDALGRDEVVGVAVVVHHRAVDRADHGQHAVDGRAVVADGRVDAASVDSARRGRRERERATEAEPDRADAAGALRHRQQMRVGRSDVDGCGVEVVALDHAERVAHAGFVLALEAGLEAPEHVGDEDHVALAGEAIGQAADVVVDPEDLLEQEDPGPGTRARHRAVRVERARAVGELDPFVPLRICHAAKGYARSGDVVPERGAT